MEDREVHRLEDTRPSFRSDGLSHVDTCARCGEMMLKKIGKTQCDACSTILKI